MSVLDYIMGLKAGEASGGGGDDPDIIRYRKEIIIPEQTVTLADGDENAELEVESGTTEPAKDTVCVLTVNETDYTCLWADLGGVNGITTPMDDNNDIYTLWYYEGFKFVKYDRMVGVIVPGVYTVEFSKLVPVTE